MRHVTPIARRTGFPHHLQPDRARSPIRPAPSASCWACSTPAGSSRWPRCWGRWAPSAPGWCTAPAGWTRSPPPARPRSPNGGRAQVHSLHDTPEPRACPCRAWRTSTAATRQQNAEALRALLEGATGAYRDIVLLNAAAALPGRRQGETLREGVELAAATPSTAARPRRAGRAPRRHHQPVQARRMSDIAGPHRRPTSAARGRSRQGREAADGPPVARRRAPPAAPRGCADRWTRRRPPGATASIAEIKKASPSKGLIRADFDPPGSGPGLSGRRRRLPVGADRHPLLPGHARAPPAARAAVALPVLRKDFMVDPCPGRRAARWARRLHPADHGRGGRRGRTGELADGASGSAWTRWSRCMTRPSSSAPLGSRRASSASTTAISRP